MPAKIVDNLAEYKAARLDHFGATLRFRESVGEPSQSSEVITNILGLSCEFPDRCIDEFPVSDVRHCEAPTDRVQSRGGRN